MHWKTEKNRTEPNELDELKYSKSLSQMTSCAHWHIFVFARSDMYQNFYLKLKQKTKLFELSELEYYLFNKYINIRKEALTLEECCS